MNLHNLDLGAPRFLEFRLCLVLDEPLTLQLLESKAWTLLERWPVLDTRLNLQVSLGVDLEKSIVDRCITADFIKPK